MVRAFCAALLGLALLEFTETEMEEIAGRVYDFIWQRSA
jgi:hypothetical protein